MTDIRSHVLENLSKLHQAPTKKVQNKTKLPFVEIDNEELLYKILIYVFAKNQFFKIEASHLTLNVDDLEGLYKNQSSKLEFKPNLIFLPQPGRYGAFYRGYQLWFTFICTESPKITTAMRRLEYERTLRIQISGDSIQPIKDLISEALASIDNSNENQLIVYENTGVNWVKTKGKRSRTLDSVILDKTISNELIEDIKEFISSREWYQRLGVPYRRIYLLEGPPGTGKSSFAQAVSGHLGLSLCFLNVSDRSLNDSNFNRLLNKAPLQSIILIEDVDAMFDGRKNTAGDNILTYSGFLNTIDGVRSQEGRMIIMTTNHKEKLDPALLRPGRIDLSVKLNYATKFQVQKLFQRFFTLPELAAKVAEQVPENTFSMAQLQGFFVKYRRSPQLILQNILQLLTTEQNVKIDDWLKGMNCEQAIVYFKKQGYSTLASVKNLDNEAIEALLGSKLSNKNIKMIVKSIRQDSLQIKKNMDAGSKTEQQSQVNGDNLEKIKNTLTAEQYTTHVELDSDSDSEID